VKAGIKLNALVAEKVMGWVWKKGEHFDVISKPQIHLLTVDQDVSSQTPGEFFYFDEDSDGERTKVDGHYRIGWYWMPAYSRDIEAAWEVVEKMAKDGEGLFDLAQHQNNWEAILSSPTGSFRANAPTAPEAICIAALKAVGIE